MGREQAPPEEAVVAKAAIEALPAAQGSAEAVPEEVDHFHRLVYEGALEQVIASVVESPRLVNARGQDGQTALHLAVRTGDKVMVACLLAYRADVLLEDDEGTAAVGMIPCMPETAPRCDIYIMLLIAGAPKASGEDIDYINSMSHICTCSYMCA